MSKLPVFDPKAPCPKCGGTDFEIRYHPKKEIRKDYVPTCAGSCWDSCIEGQHLHVVCNKCSALLSFATLDSTQEPFKLEEPEPVPKKPSMQEALIGLTKEELIAAVGQIAIEWNKRVSGL